MTPSGLTGDGRECVGEGVRWPRHNARRIVGKGADLTPPRFALSDYSLTRSARRIPITTRHHQLRTHILILTPTLALSPLLTSCSHPPRASQWQPMAEDRPWAASLSRPGSRQRRRSAQAAQAAAAVEAEGQDLLADS